MNTKIADYYMNDFVLSGWEDKSKIRGNIAVNLTEVGLIVVSGFGFIENM